MTEPASPQGSTPDPDAADTDPLVVQNPYELGWGGNWSAGGEPYFGTGAHAARYRNGTRDPVRGGLELPSAPERFAFPTSSAGPRADTTRLILMGVGALAVLAAIGTTVWLMSRSSSPDADPSAQPTTAAPVATTTAPAPAPPRNADAEGRLLRMVPTGYSPDSCEPTDPDPGTVAKVNCASNSDPGGPTSASYVLVREKTALDAAFTTVIPHEAIVVCPGNIQSPGPWRRNAAPERVAGTLVCGIPGNAPTMGWSDEERLLVSVVRSDPPGPTFEQLYQWWSTHS